MRIYVDELPKDCWDCPMHDGENGQCKMLVCYTDYIPKNCPLQSLSDYTKQVRKEVCDKIREWHDEECESLDLDSDFDVGYSGALSNLWGILDQIEGETK